MRPRMAEIEKENPNLVTEYYDYDDNREDMERFRINKDSTLPQFVFLSEKGEELARLKGEPSKKEILALVEKYSNQ